MNRSGVPLIKILLSGLLMLMLSVCVAAGVLLASRQSASADESENPPIVLNEGNITYSFILTGTGQQSNEVTYTGAVNNVPDIRVGYDTKDSNFGIIALSENVDYTVTSTDINVGQASLTITGIGKYTGGATFSNVYTIVKATLTNDNLDCTVAAENQKVDYTGTANNLPDGVVVTLNGVALQASDYELSSNSIEEGRADITVTGKGNCEGTVTLVGKYTIAKADLSENADKINCIVAGTSTLNYTGRTDNVPENVTVTYNGVTLTADDYELSTEEGAFGNAPLIITGKGKYKGSVTVENAFTIVKESNNEWIEEPMVLGWVYSQFSLTNSLLTAKPKAGVATLSVIEAKNNFTETGKVIPIAGENTFSFNSDGTLSTEIVNSLNELSVGQYWLTANVIADADKYNGIAFTRVPFEVTQLTNYWESSPNIIRWNYGEFNRDVNTVTAKPKYIREGQQVIYIVYDKDYLNAVTPSFTSDNGTDISGKVSESIARVLNSLDAGTYYFEASYYDREEGNVNPDSKPNILPLKTAIQFTIFPNQNHWETTPNIVQWKWGEFDKEINTISAVPAIGNREDVVYGIYKDSNCNDRVSETLASFKYTKNTVLGQQITYTLSDDVLAALENLDAGTYYLRATLEGTNNYTGLGAASSIEFKVQNVQNHWTATPTALSWKYGEYDKSFNKIYAEPALGETTLFGIYDKDGDAVLFADGTNVVTKFALTDGLVPEYVAQKLKTLDVGTYYMLASVEGNVNYTGLNNYTKVEDIKEYAIKFEVTTSTNTWTDIPKMLSWGEGHFDKEVNGLVATAANGNDKMVIRVYDAGGNIVATNNGGELDYDALAKLGVGSYRVTFEIEGTNNYTGLTGETTFAVFEDSVGLTGIIAAAIVFGVFDVAAAAVCVVLIVRRRKKIEQNFREMVRRELGRR